MILYHFFLALGSYPNVGDVTAFWNDFYKMKPDTASPSSSSDVNTHNPWFAELWEKTLGCRIDLNTCDPANQDLRSEILSDDPMVPFTLMAVDAIIRGTKAASMSQCGSEFVCSQLLNIKESRGSAIFNSMCSLSI